MALSSLTGTFMIDRYNTQLSAMPRCRLQVVRPASFPRLRRYRTSSTRRSRAQRNPGPGTLRTLQLAPATLSCRNEFGDSGLNGNGIHLTIWRRFLQEPRFSLWEVLPSSCESSSTVLSSAPLLLYSLTSYATVSGKAHVRPLHNPRYRRASIEQLLLKSVCSFSSPAVRSASGACLEILHNAALLRLA